MGLGIIYAMTVWEWLCCKKRKPCVAVSGSF